MIFKTNLNHFNFHLMVKLSKLHVTQTNIGINYSFLLTSLSLRIFQTILN